MGRAGREPAEDLKRRITAACREVGLEVAKAQMGLLKDHATRFVMVCASLPAWPHELPMVTVQSWVTTTGDTSPLEIFCQATDAQEDPLTCALTKPLMHGRKDVALNCLVTELQETLVERAQVLRALARGEEPPFHFDETVWELPEF